MEKVGIGIIGCGNISGAYLKAMKSFPILDIRGVADLNRELARSQGRRIRPARPSTSTRCSPIPTVEIIVNLTIPKAHVAVGLQALDAGKHTYSEKPLGINFAEGQEAGGRGSGQGLAHRRCARHLPRRRPPDGARRHRRGRDRPCRSAARPPSCARAMSAGIPIRPSTTKSAAARCSTWVPTTSPTSSTCSVPLPQVAGFAVDAAQGADHHQRAAQRRAHPGRMCRPTSPASMAFANGAVVQIAHELRRRRPQACAARNLRHRGHADRPRSEPLRRPGRVPEEGRRVRGTARSRRPMPTATTARSASPTWRMPSARTGRTAPTAAWRCMCSKSWKPSRPRPTTGRTVDDHHADRTSGPAVRIPRGRQDRPLMS